MDWRLRRPVLIVFPATLISPIVDFAFLSEHNGLKKTHSINPGESLLNHGIFVNIQGGY
jgi:hypothetical protein